MRWSVLGILLAVAASVCVFAATRGEATSPAHRLVIAGVARNPTSTASVTPLPACTWTTVTSVVDGDTIHVSLNGVDETVRYIGVDTPETVHPVLGEQPFGKEASNYNKTLVQGQEVCLEKDITDRDQYGRLLRYVWLADGRMVNELLVLAGLAVVDTFPPDVKYVDSRFLPAQKAAQAAQRGLWFDFESPTPGMNCDPAYPTVCIPPPPPDLDCSQIAYRRFTVLPPDPHRFDADRNGVGCES